MKALTLWQPWASLVAFEEKKVETRIWATKYRGLLAIHAAAKMPPEWLGASRFSEGFQQAARAVHLRRQWGPFGWNGNENTLGCVLCIVKLISIEPAAAVRDHLDIQERTFGNYDDGRYAWLLEFVERFETPIPAKGNRMLWNWRRP